MKSSTYLLAAGAALLSLSVVAQERVEPLFLRDAVGVKTYPAAPRLAQRAALAPATELPAAAVSVPEEIERIRLWNEGHNEPARNGFSRTLPDTIAVRLDGSAIAAAKGATVPFARGVVAAATGGTVVYSTSIHVAGADRLRFRLDHVVLPEGATLWIYGSNETPTGFGKELLQDGTLWTPPALGPLVYLDVEIPAPKSAADAASFEIRQVMELLPFVQSQRPDDSPTCLEDAQCISASTFDVVRNAQKAVAHLEFIEGSDTFVCTGTLLNDRNGTGTPYLLTANHCISTQTVANTLTAYFDLTTASCGGNFNFNAAPHTSGSQLLATSSASTTSDFAFLKLNSIPSGRYLLGWDPRSTSITSGVRLHRISHPAPGGIVYSQSYSDTLVNTLVGTCTGVSRPNFIYSKGGQGGIYGGSSGSASVLDGGYVVGQLFGVCGPSPSDGCNAANSTVDGAFSVTYPQIASYLESGSNPPCTPTATVACLVGGRFSVKVDWKTSDGTTGSGQAIKYTDATALFWFFSSDNIELMIKVLNACGLNSTYWIFSAATTNVQYTLTVTDSKSGVVKTYFNPQGTSAAAITDTNPWGKNALCP